MAFIPRVIQKFLDLANLAKHNDNYTDIKTELDISAAHIANETNPHGSTSAVTASKIMQRDALGRAKVAAPAASDDIAIKSTVDTVQTNLDTHAASADHDGRYYTKTNVQTSGQALLHWDNLTNKPNFADARWGAPVATKAALDAIVATQDGEVRLVLADETVYEWDTEIVAANKWKVIGAIGDGLTSHSALTNLTNDDHAQYHNDTRGDIRYYLKAAVDALLAVKIDQGGTLSANLDFNHLQALNLITHNAASAPTTPVDGQLWYDTVNKALKVYKGSTAGWVDVSGRGALIKDESFTALAAQTVYNITVGSYEVATNAISVYKQSGSLFELLPESAYTETSATSITMASAAVGGEIFYIKFFENSPEIINQAVQKDGTLQVNLNSDMTDGFHASAAATANNIAVRDGSGKLPGDILGNAATVTTNANLTGDITSVGNATTIATGVVTDAKLATDNKIGSLAALTTTNKSSIVAAVNEHLADNTQQFLSTKRVLSMGGMM